MRPTPDLLRRQFREPALHEVQPRAIGGCEVHVKPGTLGEPRPDERCFVRSVIVQDEVTSRSAGTLAAMRSRNLRNSMDRWRRCVWPITLPLLASSAANSEVVPWRL